MMLTPEQVRQVYDTLQLTLWIDRSTDEQVTMNHITARMRSRFECLKFLAEALGEDWLDWEPDIEGGTSISEMLEINEIPD